MSAISAFLLATAGTFFDAIATASTLHSAVEQGNSLYGALSRKLRGPLPAQNHDVALAVRMSYLRALQFHLAAWAGKLKLDGGLQHHAGFVEQAQKYLRDQVATNAADNTLLWARKFEALAGLERMAGMAEHGDLSAESSRLIDAVRAEFRAEAIELPYDYLRALTGNSGFVPPLAGLEVFVQVEMAEQIKTNERFRSVMLYGSSLEVQEQLKDVAAALAESTARAHQMYEEQNLLIATGYDAIREHLAEFGVSADELQQQFESFGGRIGEHVSRLAQAVDKLQAANARTNLRLTAPWRESGAQPEGEFDVLKFRYRLDEFAGARRGQDLKRLVTDFLEVGRPDRPKMTYAILQGSAGQGKSRLAMDLAEIAEEEGFLNSGFLRLSDVVRDVTVDHNGRPILRSVRDWEFHEDTFLVIDYARQYRDFLQSILEALGDKFPQNGTKTCRVLLLIRDQERGLAGRIKPVRSSDSYQASHLNGPDDDPVLELQALTLAELVRIARGRMPTMSGRTPDGPIEEAIRSLAGDRPTPLLAAIAGQYLERGQGRPDAATRDNVFRDLFRREQENFWYLDRVWNDAEKTRFEDALMYLTLLRGGQLDINAILDETAPDEDGEDGVDLRKVRNRIRDIFLESDQETFLPIEPDILGEWFVLDRFKGFANGTGARILGNAWKRKASALEIENFVPMAWYDYPEVVETEFMFGLPSIRSSGKRSWIPIDPEIAPAAAGLSSAMMQILAWQIAQPDSEGRRAALADRALVLEERFRDLITASGADITKPPLVALLLEARVTAVSAAVAALSDRERRSIRFAQEEQGIQSPRDVIDRASHRNSAMSLDFQDRAEQELDEPGNQNIGEGGRR